MTSPPPSRPEFTAPQFEGCYLHPDRSTGITCQRCGRAICGECMHPASVGFQCPQCIGRGRAEVRRPRTRYGARVGNGAGPFGTRSIGNAPVTKVLMVVIGALWLLNFASRGLVNTLLAQANYAIAGGQVWRLVTGTFTSGGLLSTALTLLVLYIVGRWLESELGGARFLVLYLLAGLGGATVTFVAGPPGLAVVGGSGAVIGLLAANAGIKLQRREDIRPDLILLALLLAMNFIAGSWLGGLSQLGGVVTGLLAGLVLAYAPPRRRTEVQVLGLAAIVVVCALAVAARIAVL